MKTIITNIKRAYTFKSNHVGPVAGNDMKSIDHIDLAFIIMKDGLIEKIGLMENLDSNDLQNAKVIDATGQFALPTFVDSHTHIVFAEPRHEEFVDRIKGLSYEEIAKRGGGILNSAKKLQEFSEDQLYNDAMTRIEEHMKLGTGAIEIKSGYGLTVEAEIKMLRVIKRIKENAPIPVKATFLGAHALPPSYKDNRAEYLRLITEEMLPTIAKEGLADYIDAFCESSYFTPEETEMIIKAGAKYGLKAKVHVNQFNSIGGLQTCVEQKALSVDHLEEMNEEDFETLRQGNTLPVALPSCSFFLSIPYTPGRRIIDEGMPLVLATDFNPGSTPTGNMQFVVSLACIKMKLLPEEAFNASILNGAYALELENEVGSLEVGKRANIMLTKVMDSLNFFPYNFGNTNLEKVFINGEEI